LQARDDGSDIINIAVYTIQVPHRMLHCVRYISE
jgi:hypothetical protein